MPTLDFRHDPIEKNVISNEPLEITFFFYPASLVFAYSHGSIF